MIDLANTSVYNGKTGYLLALEQAILHKFNVFNFTPWVQPWVARSYLSSGSLSATLSEGTQKKLITSVAERSVSLYEPCPYFYPQLKRLHYMQLSKIPRSFTRKLTTVYRPLDRGKFLETVVCIIW